MSVYAETPGSGQVLYGVNSRFKINVCGSVTYDPGEGNVLHLTRAKPQRITKFVDFQAIYHGTLVEAGGFYYTSEDGMLHLENATAGIGIEPDPEDSAEIELNDGVDSQVALLSMHLEPGSLPE